MCRLIESIRCLNGRLYNMPYHLQRMNRARKELFGSTTSIHLHREIAKHNIPEKGLYKCRVLYKQAIEHIEFVAYQMREIRSLKLVYSNDISYPFKYEQRENLARLFSLRQACDDILIVKNNCITDTSYSNIVFFDGKQWITPAAYLLNGTQRQSLLAKGKIKEYKITVSDLSEFKHAKIINAMMPLTKTNPKIPIKAIR